jgi:nucleoside-diphosphate-sugar epimerase
MRCLVTGGAGFIGSHTVDELVRRGHSVTVLDDLSAGKEENLSGVLDKIEFIHGSICDLACVQQACRGCDCVFHLAARTSVPASIKNPLETNRVNIDGTLNVLVGARDAKVRRIVYAASSSAYGETLDLPKVETMQPVPISPYGVTKLVGEMYAQVFGRAYSVENVSLRYFNVFGPRQDPSSQYSGVLSRFIFALLSGEQPVVFGDGQQSRDFTFVADVVNANLKASEASDASGKVFNIGTSSRISLNEVLKVLEGISGSLVRATYGPARVGDIQHSQADIRLAGEVLGYKPSVRFEEGLRRTWEWYRTTDLAALAPTNPRRNTS